MTIIFNKFFIFPFQFADNSGYQLLNKTVPVAMRPFISSAKRGRIVDRCTKSGWKGIPNLRYGGQIDKSHNHKQQINDNSLFIPHERCRLLAYGGQNDKANLPDRCTKSE